jgi:cation diffusion facilitator CzcD-associated flavoprotein CzcO
MRQQPDEDSVAVIGAGLSGLVACRELRHRGVSCVCFESEQEIGGVWRQHPDVVTVTCRDAMALDAFPMPPDMPEFPNGRALVAHLGTYAEEFDLHEDIRLGCAVTNLSLLDDGRWEVQLAGGERSVHRAVILATGRIGEPEMPAFQGSFDGALMHVGELEDMASFADQRVIVVGFGNSAADVACDVSRHARTTYLSIRSGGWVVPRFFAGRPLDKASGPLVARIPMRLRMPFYRALLYALHGTPESFGLPRPVERLGSKPLTVSDELLPAIGAGRITPVGTIAKLHGREVELRDGRLLVADAIICATGYRIEVPLLDDVLAERALLLEDLWHNMVHLKIENLYVLGAMVAFGAIPPLVEAQARLAADLISGYGRLPADEQLERDLGRERFRRNRFAPSVTRKWMVGETAACLQRLERARAQATGRALRDIDVRPVVAAGSGARRAQVLA